MKSAKNTPMANGLLTAAAFVIVVAGIKQAEAILVPFLLSVFIVLIVTPLLSWLKARKVPSGLAITLIILAMLLGSWLIGILMGSSISDFRTNMPEYQARLTDMGHELLGWLGQKGIVIEFDQLRSKFDPGVVMTLAGNTLSSFGNVMTNAFMILLTVVFILAEEVSFADKLKTAKGKNYSDDGTLASFASSINSYLGLKTLMSLLTGILVMIWLLILGVDYPVMWGTLAFMLNFVPTVGSIVAAVPAVLLALIQLGPGYAGLTALGYVVVNVGVGNVLEPKVMGNGLNLSPLVVFLSLVFWGWLLGPVGMLLSIPLTIMAKLALEQREETRWIGVMLGSGGATRDGE